MRRRVDFYFPNPTRVGLPISHVAVETEHIPRVGESVQIEGDGGGERQVESILYKYTKPCGPPGSLGQSSSIVINLK